MSTKHLSRVAGSALLAVTVAVAMPLSAASASPGLTGRGGMSPNSQPMAASRLVTSNEETAFDFFVEQGFSTIQAAGIIGNLDQESGVNPTSVQSDGPGRGIAQWSVGGRWDTENTFAASINEDPWSLDAQLRFIMNEFSRGYGYEQVKDATTIDDATLAFEVNYEVCGTCNTAARESFAQTAYDNYANSVSPGAAGGSAVTVPGEYHDFWVNPANGHMMQSWYVTASPGWREQDLGGSLVGTPGVTYHDGRYDVFATAPNGNLYQDIYTSGGGWMGWQPRLSGWAPGVSAVFDGAAYHVFGHNSSGALLQGLFTSSWQTQNLGGTTYGTPGVAEHEGIFDVFSISAGGGLYERSYEGSWDTWHLLPGGGTYGTAFGVAAVWAGSGDYVLAPNANGHLYEQYFNGSWSAPLSLGGTLSDTVGVTYANGRFDLFGPASGGLSQQTYYPGTGWNGWHQVI